MIRLRARSENTTVHFNEVTYPSPLLDLTSPTHMTIRTHTNVIGQAAILLDNRGQNNAAVPNSRVGNNAGGTNLSILSNLGVA